MEGYPDKLDGEYIYIYNTHDMFIFYIMIYNFFHRLEHVKMILNAFEMDENWGYEEAFGSLHIMHTEFTL